MVNSILVASTLVLSVLGGTGSEPTFEFGFDMSHADGAAIVGSSGETVRIEGFLTLASSEAGLGGFTQSVEVRSPSGADFCIDAALTESFTPTEKQDLLGVCLLALFPAPVTYVIQNDVGSCRGGSADPDSEGNNGRRGLVDATVVCIGLSMEAGFFRTLPVAST